MAALDLLEQLQTVKMPVSIDLERYYIDVSKTLDKETELVSYKGVQLFSAGNLSTVTGKAKSRKTFFASAVAASVISGECLGIVAKHQGSVLYIDTEQSEYHVQNVAKRILRLSGLDPEHNIPNLQMYALRPVSTEERVEALKKAIELTKPQLVIIDGIRDLLHDFNNISESSNLICLLMKLSADYHCHILSVLHQNKADNNMRGHAGTELLNKSETVLEVSTLDNISTVKAIASRGMSPEEIYFQVSTSGLPIECNCPDNVNAKKEVAEGMMRQIIGQSSKQYGQLKDDFMELACCSEKTAKRRIADLLSSDFLEKDDNGYYRIKNKSVDDYNDLPD